MRILNTLPFGAHRIEFLAANNDLSSYKKNGQVNLGGWLARLLSDGMVLGELGIFLHLALAAPYG